MIFRRVPLWDTVSIVLADQLYISYRLEVKYPHSCDNFRRMAKRKDNFSRKVHQTIIEPFNYVLSINHIVDYPIVVIIVFIFLVVSEQLVSDSSDSF